MNGFDGWSIFKGKRLEQMKTYQTGLKSLLTFVTTNKPKRARTATQLAAEAVYTKIEKKIGELLSDYQAVKVSTNN